MAAETSRSSFTIDGTRYEVPLLDDFDFSDWELVYDRTGLVFQDFGPIVDDPKLDAEREHRAGQPGFMRCLVEVAVRRANPEMSHEQVAALVAKQNMMRILLEIGETTVEDDANPPALTPAPEPSSPSSADDLHANGSTPSSDESAVLAGDPLPTGTPE